MNVSEAIRAKSAAERATIAANLLKGTKERNKDLGREFDDCFLRWVMETKYCVF
jgi:hypothetical protein